MLWDYCKFHYHTTTGGQQRSRFTMLILVRAQMLFIGKPTIPPVKQTEFGWFHLNLKEMMQWQMHESQLMQSRKFVLEQDLRYQIISELDVIWTEETWCQSFVIGSLCTTESLCYCYVMSALDCKAQATCSTVQHCDTNVNDRCKRGILSQP